MVTKTKTLETSVSVLDPSVEQALLEGLAKLNAGELSAAAVAFESIQSRSVSKENLGLSHAAQYYLAAIKSRLEDRSDPCRETVEMSAQLLINRRDSVSALEVIDEAIKESPQRAVLYYLKATAHAQLEQEQESVNALIKAIDIDHDFIFRFKLESDFDNVRNADAFSVLSLE